MGREVLFPKNPKRIVSLVPSQTELLFDLGKGEEVVGVTKFCVHPSTAKNKTIVGGTKSFQFDVINDLRPDLIIGNKEENYQEGIERLTQHYPVWMSDISSVDDAIDMISNIGELTNCAPKAQHLVEEINQAFETLPNFEGLSVLYLIWLKPFMAAGQGTFIDSLLNMLNLQNVVSDSRYPEVSPEDYRNPDIVMLSSEPFPFQEKHKHQIQQLFPDSSIKLVDGEMFSWYGSRLKLSVDYFRKLANSL